MVNILTEQDTFFGSIAFRNKLITREQLSEAVLRVQSATTALRLGDVFVEMGYITPEQVEAILGMQKGQREALAEQQPALAPAAPPLPGAFQQRVAGGAPAIKPFSPQGSSVRPPIKAFSTAASRAPKEIKPFSPVSAQPEIKPFTPGEMETEEKAPSPDEQNTEIKPVSPAAAGTPVPIGGAEIKPISPDSTKAPPVIKPFSPGQPAPKPEPAEEPPGTQGFKPAFAPPPAPPEAPVETPPEPDSEAPPAIEPFSTKSSAAPEPAAEEPKKPGADTQQLPPMDIPAEEVDAADREEPEVAPAPEETPPPEPLEAPAPTAPPPAPEAPPPSKTPPPAEESPAAVETERSLPPVAEEEYQEPMEFEAPPLRGVAVAEEGLEVPTMLRNLQDYLMYARAAGASDLHISPEVHPFLRLSGRIHQLEVPPLPSHETQRLLFGVLSTRQKSQLMHKRGFEFCLDIPGSGRFRASIVKQRCGWDGIFHIVRSKVPSCEELGLPECLTRLTEYNQGLVLVTGPGNSGKTTTLAALLDAINSSRTDHIIALEQPVEYLHTPKQCQFTQREVGNHTRSFSIALRGALRQDPDVIMVGELRDLETLSMSISASETGHLVFGTLHTTSAAATVGRVVDAFPVGQQAQIRMMISESLRGIISQQLVPAKTGVGVVLALEILFVIPAVSALIRDNKPFQLPSIMQTSRRIGMCRLDDSLLDLVNEGLIEGAEAYRRAENKSMFKSYAPEKG